MQSERGGEQDRAPSASDPAGLDRGPGCLGREDCGEEAAGPDISIGAGDSLGGSARPEHSGLDVGPWMTLTFPWQTGSEQALHADQPIAATLVPSYRGGWGHIREASPLSLTLEDWYESQVKSCL